MVHLCVFFNCVFSYTLSPFPNRVAYTKKKEKKVELILLEEGGVCEFGGVFSAGTSPSQADREHDPVRGSLSVRVINII